MGRDYIEERVCAFCKVYYIMLYTVFRLIRTGGLAFDHFFFSPACQSITVRYFTAVWISYLQTSSSLVQELLKSTDSPAAAADIVLQSLIPELSGLLMNRPSFEALGGKDCGDEYVKLVEKVG